MAKKVRLTRPELKRQRDALARYERYLPMLKLKQQQLQMAVLGVERKRRLVVEAQEAVDRQIAVYRPLLRDLAGLNIEELARPVELKTSTTNIAGVRLPVFEEALFGPVRYSLFGTPPWVDRAIADLRQLNRHRAEAEILIEQERLLRRELTRIVQRVNLFEKLKIPTAREDIRIIRIHLGDQQTAGVGRAKIAKAKLSQAAADEALAGQAEGAA